MAAPRLNHGGASYMTLVPRGLQHVAVERLKQKFKESGHSLKDIRFVGERNPEQEEAYKQHLNTLLSERKKKIYPRIGAVWDSSTNKHISVGYDSTGQSVWAYPGHSASVWVSFSTDAPAHFVGTELRCIGPLLAEIHLWEGINLSESQSIDHAESSVSNLLSESHSPAQLDRAIKVWHAHVQDAWPLSLEKLEEIKQKVQGVKSLKYRISCMRTEPKQYSYSREDFVKAVAEYVVPADRKWDVDLSNYDLEVVLLIQSSCLAIGLALRPYRQLEAKCFSSGTLPPDVTPPYLSGSILSGIVRLRPTTSQLMWQLINFSPGDVVLDPCAGIGTIPLEAPRGTVGIGGDLVLSAHSMGSVAAQYTKQMCEHNSFCKSNLLAWDANCLPLRPSCVDAVVSDLPFGQQCLSSSKLEAMLPLLLGKMGRVLRPNTGCMLLLCGSFAPILDTLQQLNKLQSEGDIWNLPCETVFPVNIGGLVAWLMKVTRGPGEGVLVPNHRERARKFVAKRERVDTLRAKQLRESTKDGCLKYRRLQA